MDDLVAHLQRTETWDVVSLPVMAEKDEFYEPMTPYGRRLVQRKAGDILHPALMSASTVGSMRESMTAYNFAAQYQQDPQPPSGLIVKRNWLKFYSGEERPESFDQIVQSWDTANKVTELSDYSVCTTWGYKEPRMYLLDVSRQKLEFPELKRTVRELATLWQATVVLIEDKASGTQLIQQLRADGFSQIQAAPPSGDNKIMRLHAQTAKIQGQFVLFPEKAHWLDAYLLELTSFPNSKNDDQVDSTINALAWITQEANKPGMGMWHYARQESEKIKREREKKYRVRIPAGTSTLILSGRMYPVTVPPDRIVEVTYEEMVGLLRAGAERLD
jgi:predicted phage terminase large subunit-like protein